MRGVKTFYHYSDSGLVAEMDASGNVRKSYGYRPGSPWGTDPLFMRENGKNYWYLNDHLGTPQVVVSENGGVVWKAQYQVFGKEEISNDSTVTNNLRFPGQYFDEETGMHYNWNRYYDPESGRYIQTDPIGLNVLLFNLNTFTNNNPILKYDNSGLYPDCTTYVINSFISSATREDYEYAGFSYNYFSIKNVRPSISENLDIFNPSNPPISPDILFQLWYYENKLYIVRRYRIFQKIEDTLSLCTEDIIDECGEVKKKYYPPIKIKNKKVGEPWEILIDQYTETKSTPLFKIGEFSLNNIKTIFKILRRE